MKINKNKIIQIHFDLKKYILWMFSGKIFCDKIALPHSINVIGSRTILHCICNSFFFAVILLALFLSQKY